MSCSPITSTPTQGCGTDNASDSRHRQPSPVRVAVQHRQRLFRVGLTALLDAADDVSVVASTDTEDELVAACAELRPAVAVIEARPVEREGRRLATVLRRTQPSLAVVGLAAPTRPGPLGTAADHLGLTALVPHVAGIAGVLAAIRRGNAAGKARPVHPANWSDTGRAASALTGREIEVLTLVGAGMTATEVAAHLRISHKTVENHKQRIFAKLEVQNQAHAVAVAIRAGLIPAELVIRSALHACVLPS